MRPEDLLPWRSTDPEQPVWAEPNQPLIMVEPGTKTLPIGGMLGFPNEHEHIIGGRMKVLSSSPSVIRLQQVDPTIHPVPPRK